jgi:ATP-binding cassette, subfamily B, multidrug efflux pump
MSFGGIPGGPSGGPGSPGPSTSEPGRGTFGDGERGGRRSSDWELLKRFLKYLKRYKGRVILIVIFVVIGALCDTLTPYLHSIVINQIIGEKNLGGLHWWIPVFIGVATLSFAMQYFQQALLAVVGENVISEFREDMIEKLQVLSLRYFAEGETGRVMSRVTNDAETVRNFYRTGITSIIGNFVTICGDVVLMVYLSPQLALVSLAVLPLVVIFTNFIGKYTRREFRKTRVAISTVTSLTQESVAGMRVIQTFTREEGTMEAFDEAQKENVKATLSASKYAISVRPLITLIRAIGTVIVLWYALSLYQSGLLNIATQLGILVAFLEYQTQLFTPLMMLSTVFMQYQSAMAALERMYDIIDTDVEVKELPQDEIIQLPPIQREIRYDNVTFGYNPEVPVLHDVSFVIPSNHKVAIVGPTGGGKTTLINLLCRFYDPISGEVCIDDYNLKDVSLAALRSYMGIVLQDSFLFNITVKENIRFGRPTASDEEVMEAAKAVGAHEFIMILPDGYDTVISEGSSNISLGQRQLISFARALLINPRILILDEATSSVDPYTELIIQNALQKILETRTAIIIAHRLSTVRSADKIIVLDKGRIVEEGTHRELLERNGLYSLLYRSQLRDDVKVESYSQNT